MITVRDVSTGAELPYSAPTTDRLSSENYINDNRTSDS
jgi:hypothetical protein